LNEYQDCLKYQRLYIDFEAGEDPDDAYSTVPYEKGANFLLHLERTLGGLDVFLPYVKDYVNTYQGKSITTEMWKEHLYTYFRKHGGEDKINALNSVDFNAWLHGDGMELPVKMEYDDTLAKQAYEIAEKWNRARDIPVDKLPFKASDVESLNSNQRIVLLERLQSYDPFQEGHLKHLGKIYGFASTNNAEVRFRYYQLALRSKTLVRESVCWAGGLEDGIIKGRMKFCRPLFRTAGTIDSLLAKDIFGQTKDGFHPIARRMISKDLGIV
jgi:leukotriene-A4 hydrolase